MRENMPPEDQLCLLLTRGHLNPEVRTRTLQFLANPLQWALILERAYSHQVYPLLYRNLLELGFPGVPHEVQTELKSAYLANAFRNQLLAEELAHLLKVLGEAGIPGSRSRASPWRSHSLGTPQPGFAPISIFW